MGHELMPLCNSKTAVYRLQRSAINQRPVEGWEKKGKKEKKL